MRVGLHSRNAREPSMNIRHRLIESAGNRCAKPEAPARYRFGRLAISIAD